MKRNKPEICELCLDPKRKTTHLEADSRIRAVHKDCYEKAKQALYKFFHEYGIGEPNFKTKSIGKRMIHKWLHNQ
jgi:hypothetical protein